jgi:hypothetical protein
MLSPADEAFVARHAYVPEHVPGYVTAVSAVEPHLVEGYLCYQAGATLIFIGYPLGRGFESADLARALPAAVARFRPRQVALTAPALPDLTPRCEVRERDAYYRINLASVRVPAKERSLIRRAARELRVEQSRQLGAAHEALIAAFLASHGVAGDARRIYERMPAYLTGPGTARLFSARDPAGELAAFAVVDLGGQAYAFYQFSIRSAQRPVPGASDLLLSEVIAAARGEGKTYLNLGLGVHGGVTRFKEKWGAEAFLPYEYGVFRPRRPGLLDALLRLP